MDNVRVSIRTLCVCVCIRTLTCIHTHTHVYIYIYIYVYNVGRRLVSWYPIVGFFQNNWVSCEWWGWGSIVIFFFWSNCLKQKTQPFIHRSLSKAGPFTLEKPHMVRKHQNARFPKKDAWLNPYKKKTAPKQFFKRVPHEWHRSSIMWLSGNFWGEKNTKPLNHLSWAKLVHVL